MYDRWEVLMEPNNNWLRDDPYQWTEKSHSLGPCNHAEIIKITKINTPLALLPLTLIWLICCWRTDLISCFLFLIDFLWSICFQWSFFIHVNLYVVYLTFCSCVCILSVSFFLDVLLESSEYFKKQLNLN